MVQWYLFHFVFVVNHFTVNSIYPTSSSTNPAADATITITGSGFFTSTESLAVQYAVSSPYLNCLIYTDTEIVCDLLASSGVDKVTVIFGSDQCTGSPTFTYNGMLHQ